MLLRCNSRNNNEENTFIFIFNLMKFKMRTNLTNIFLNNKTKKKLRHKILFAHQHIY